MRTRPVYREAATPTPADPPPRELVYVAIDRAEKKRPSMGLFQVIVLPVVVACLLSVVATPLIALIGMVVTAVGLFVWWKRAGIAPELSLVVDDGVLRV